VDALDDLLSASAFVTVHVPLADATRGLIGAAEIARMPAGAIVLNFAREGIVDERAVVAALDAGHLAAYVSDFPVEATRHHAKCVTLPHLGASTDEAEENCAIMVADQIRAFLEDGDVHNSVNFPEVSLPRSTPHRLVCAARSRTALAAQAADVLQRSGITMAAMANVSRGDLAYLVADLSAALPESALGAIAGLDGIVMARTI
jgi:D-3-phosphoglycerate dehydrogenase